MVSLLKLARFVDNGNLAAGAKTRIDANRNLGSSGWSHQQISHIFCEHLHGFGIGFFFQLLQQRAFGSGTQQTLVAVSDGFFELRAEFEIWICDKSRFQLALLRFVIHPQTDSKNAFRFTSLHRQKTVCWHFGNAFVTVEVVFKLAAFFCFTFLHDGNEFAALSLIHHPLAIGGSFGPCFGHDVARAANGCFFIGDIFSGINKRL